MYCKIYALRMLMVESILQLKDSAPLWHVSTAVLSLHEGNCVTQTRLRFSTLTGQEIQSNNAVLESPRAELVESKVMTA